MAKARTLVLNTKVNVTGADKLRGLSQQMSGLSKVVTGLAIGFATTKVTQFLGSAIQDASDLAETVSKVDAVFGESAKEVQAWASTAADSLGQSKRVALEAASTYGNLFQAFGIGEQKAKDMSIGLVQLATDLASFNNTSVEEAIDALRSGLSGETEPLKRYGSVISDVRLKQEALTLGLIKTTDKVLPPAIKAQATYSLVMKDTAKAQGDFERTSGGLAAQQKILTAKFEEISAEIGEKLLPAMVDLVEFINKDGLPALREFADVVSDNVETIVRGVERVVGAYKVMRDGVLTVLEVLPGEVGFWAEETEKAITGPMDKMANSAEEAAHDGVVRMASAFEEGTPAVTIAVADMAAAILDILDIQTAKMRNLGFQQQVEYAKGMLDAQNNVKVAIEAALQIVEDEMTKTEEIAYLSGQRGTLMLARGIASAEGKTASVLAIDGALALLRQRLGDLGVEFYTGGFSIGTNWAKGLKEAITGQIPTIGVVVNGVRRILGSSLPTAGPLAGKAAERGGSAIGQAWLGAIQRAIGAGLDLSGTAAALSGLGALTPALAGGGGGGTTNIYNNFTFSGTPSGSPNELSSLLRDLSAVSGGDVRYG